MYVQLLTNPFKNYKEYIVVTFEKTTEISWKILPKNALSVLVLCKNLTFFGNKYFFFGLRCHVIPTWESPTAADNF